MTALAVYFGVSSVSFLLENGDGLGYEYVNFPYVYSPELFSNYVSEQAFYKSLFDSILKKKKAKYSDFDILVTGYPLPPKLPFQVTTYVSLEQVIAENESLYPIVVDNFSVITKDTAVSYVSAKGTITSDRYDKNIDEVSYYANLSVYPQLVSPEIATQLDIDRNIVSKAADSIRMSKDTKYCVFSGNRFSQKVCTPEVNYALALDLMSEPGIFKIYIDQKNLLVLTNLIKTYKSGSYTYTDFEELVPQSGVVVRTGGEVECLVDFDVGSNQLVQVPEDHIFVVPVTSASRARLQVKSAVLGSIDKTVVAGPLGIIFDTRKRGSTISANMRLLNECISQFSRVSL